MAPIPHSTGDFSAVRARLQPVSSGNALVMDAKAGWGEVGRTASAGGPAAPAGAVRP